jgi:hypothetical protein
MYPVANQFSAGSIEQTSSLPTLFSGTAFLFLFLAISSLGGLLVLKEK